MIRTADFVNMKIKIIKNRLSQTRFDEDTQKNAYNKLVGELDVIKKSKPSRGSKSCGQKLANTKLLACICCFCEHFFGDEDRLETWPSSNKVDEEFGISLKNLYTVMKVKHASKYNRAKANALAKRIGFDEEYYKMKATLLAIAS